MPMSGYREYQRREFCKDVRCPIQLKLDAESEGTPPHDALRGVCKTECKYTTYQFHHWLIDKGYLIVRRDT